MDLDRFIERIVKPSTQQQVFFHFTDTRNLQSIQAHGLLSTKQLRGRGIVVPALGGNEWSLDADRASGMDAFVHLCFMIGHPMEHHARERGQLENVIYLRIRPEIIKRPGAMMTLEVSNQSGVAPVMPAEGLDGLDVEVIYRRTDWRDRTIQTRLQAAHRCELLIPDCVPVEFITNLGNG